MADPRAVDLEGTKIKMMVDDASARSLLSHLRSDDTETSDIGQNTHNKVSVRHAAIDFQMLQIRSRV